MATQHTLARALHDAGLAAWFGGSLMGAVGLNGASREASSPTDRARIANAGWGRWTPVNAAAIAAHLVGGAQLVRGNKARLAAQSGVGTTSALKAAATAAALAATAYARWQGQQVMTTEFEERVAPTGPDGLPVADATTPASNTPGQAAGPQRQLAALQWVVPALTGTLVALNAKQGEQQRPTAVASGVVQRLADNSDRIGTLAAAPAAAAAAFVVVGSLIGRSVRRRRRKRRGNLRARDIMTKDVEMLPEDATLADAARRMAARDIGALPIRGRDGRLTGVVTDRDIVVEAVAGGRDPRIVTAATLMSGKPITVDADDSIDEALHTMARHKVRRLPVTDDGKVIGMLSQGDIAVHLPPERIGDLVESISAAS